MEEIILTEEEREFILRRREAVKHYVAFCNRPFRGDSVMREIEDEIQDNMEEELRNRWGVYP